MPLRLTICLFVFSVFAAKTTLGQAAKSKEISNLMNMISDRLYANKNDMNMSKDGIFTLSLRIGKRNKVDSVFQGHIAGENSELTALKGISFDSWKQSEQGIRYIIVPIVILNPKNDAGENETVSEIYRQSFQKFKGKRSGNTLYTKTLLFIRSLPIQ